ncbi:MAG: tRNA lysidine(34) synthetase TilS [Alphaproteobacteria bacterium]
MSHIAAEEFASILRRVPALEDARVLAVACSGGPDSMALTLLLHAWAQTHGRQVVALTVDHGLRAVSAQEALQVQQWLHDRGIAHEILPWLGEKPRTRIQETAREMRYHLLATWCQEHRVPVLLTAHHAQDQAETFLMRLAKGSGLRGLCAMRALVERLPVKLVRPLLTISPQRLHLTLKQFQQPFIEDVSNANHDFERVRWRHTWAALTQHGLTLDAVLTTIGRLTESQNLIDGQLAQMVTQFLTKSPYGYLIVDWQGAQVLPAEAIELLLTHTLWLFSNKGWQSKYQAVKALCSDIRKGQRRIFTLGGAIIQVKGPQLLIFREVRAAPPPQVLGEGAHTLWWDRRFLLDIEVPQGETITLKPLGTQARSKEIIPTRALLAMPSFWREDNLFFSPTTIDDTINENGWLISVRSHWRKL